MARRRHVEIYRGRPDKQGRVWRFRLVHANGDRAERSNQAYARPFTVRRGAARAHPGLPVVVVTR